jgi:ribosomal protein L11
MESSYGRRPRSVKVPLLVVELKTDGGKAPPGTEVEVALGTLKVNV